MLVLQSLSLGIFFAAILSGCATLSPVSGVRETPSPATDIPSIRAEWQPVAIPGEAAVGTGIFYYAGRIASPRLQFHALKISLNNPAGPIAGPRLRIVVGPEAVRPGAAGSGIVPSTYVTSFVKNNKLIVGINATPFDPSSAREGEERFVVGIGIANGRPIAPPVSRFDALVFYADGSAAIVNQGALPGQEILHAAGGFHCILRDGELTERAIQKRDTPRYARSAVGLSADGRVLYLIAIDGGQLGKPGATEAETALILKHLGAQDALNLDGGGSSALALRLPDNTVRTLNTPAHGGIPGKERAVALCVGFGVE
jgi:hypothetical protein